MSERTWQIMRQGEGEVFGGDSYPLCQEVLFAPCFSHSYNSPLNRVYPLFELNAFNLIYFRVFLLKCGIPKMCRPAWPDFSTDRRMTAALMFEEGTGQKQEQSCSKNCLEELQVQETAHFSL